MNLTHLLKYVLTFALVLQCMPLASLADEDGASSSGGGDPNVVSFLEKMNQICIWIPRSSVYAQLSGSKCDALYKALQKSVSGKGPAKLRFVPDQIYDQNGVPKSAFFDKKTQSIIVYKADWDKMTPTQQLITVGIETGGHIDSDNRYGLGSLVKANANSILALSDADRSSPTADDYFRLLSLVRKLGVKREALKKQGVKPNSPAHQEFLDGASELLSTFNKNRPSLLKIAALMGPNEIDNFESYYDAARTIYSSSISGFSTVLSGDLFSREGISDFTKTLDALDTKLNVEGGETLGHALSKLNPAKNVECPQINSEVKSATPAASMTTDGKTGNSPAHSIAPR